MNRWKQTNTTLFLVPILGHDTTLLTKEYGFIDGFMADANKETSYLYPVFLVFKPEDLGDFQEFVDREYLRTSDLVLDYDYDGGFVVLVYQFPDKFQKDYRRFKQGKYSKLSLEFSARLPAYEKSSSGNNIPEMSIQRRIILQTPEFIESMMEIVGEDIMKITGQCWSIPKMEDETLDIGKLKRRLKKFQLGNNNT